jgi:hypothetical protein
VPKRNLFGSTTPDCFDNSRGTAVREEYAVSSDGMRMFGVMDLSSGFDGCRFAIGLRNSHDKSFRLSCTVGLRVFCSPPTHAPLP